MYSTCERQWNSWLSYSKGVLVKIWSKLKSLHASQTPLSKSLQDVRNLQNLFVLNILVSKKGSSIKDDRLLWLTTLLSNEGSNLRGLIP